MTTHTPSSLRWRDSTFTRDNASPSPGPPPGHARSKSSILVSPLAKHMPPLHARGNSLTEASPERIASGPRYTSTASPRQGSPGPGTFAPKFIKTELDGASDKVGGIEGENDFSGKRYVWVKDSDKAFVKGWVVEETTDQVLKVQCEDGSHRDVEADDADKVNPAKFDKADDMAELTHLNEASVVHNLHMRYDADLIYTYSGLFLVTVNPYCPLPIYGRDFVSMYKGRSREDSKPHIFAVADEAFRNLVDEGANQSILVTGESGAGKTENTKRVIQYLASVALNETPKIRNGAKPIANLSDQILRANPILEAFGNAQTVRNHNSSRFGKFIRIEFTRTGQIAGAFIDWYLLEKSRVVRVGSAERNYHIFYQLLRGADRKTREKLLLGKDEVDDFEYTRHGNDTIPGVSDAEEWNSLIEAFHIMGFTDQDQISVLQTIGAILHLGNIVVEKESLRGDQGSILPSSMASVEKFCKLSGIPSDQFLKGLLHPKVKAGREWVEKVQTPEQVRLAIDALAKGIYERGFGDLVNKINSRLDRAAEASDDTHFIGVLDIAGFEIFEYNSFEQLCINYTNEKLQQFFNHHMFVLEQEEYAREQIDWKFIDFGRDLQPTIDLIEVTNPIGLFSCLDEDSVMPKATDKSFTEKLHSLWEKKTPKYRRSLLNQGFMLTHYAADVEYSTEGWLEKNKDPLNDNVTRLLASSTDKHIAHLFADCAEVDDDVMGGRSKVKRGLFRTVAQRHKEQLSSLMSQLHSTHPHFVRCILPNHKKRPKQWNGPLVLDQLRCNGVLEGIRIARTGFPNRLPFAEFRSRYEVLCPNMPKGYIEGQAAAKVILEKLNLDPSWYRVGLTKVFFRAGVLAELEEQRDALIQDIIARFQAVANGYIQRKIAHKRLYRAEATRIIQRNLQAYAKMQANPWWMLFNHMRPLLGATRQATEVKKREEEIKKLQAMMQAEEQQRQRVEEERRRAETEMQRIQNTLESERALALDKEEIFKRLQGREIELSEKLQDAIADQDDLESQIDGLLEAKKSAESRANDMQIQLEQAGAIIGKMETEKQEMLKQMHTIEKQSQSGLSEKLADAIAAQDRLRSQVHELEQAKKSAESRANDIQAQLEKAVPMINKMQEERQELLKQMNTLNAQDREFNDLQARLQEEKAKLADTTSSLELYRQRSEEYFSKLDQAEVAVSMATRAEQFAKSQAKEADDAFQKLSSERKQVNALVEDLQRRNKQYEEQMEDVQADLDAALQTKKRFQKELEDYRGQRALEVEDKEAAVEQTRSKYQNELASLTRELEKERDSVISARSEHGRLRDEVEGLRNKLEDEALTLSSWAKDKSRLEGAMQDLSTSRDEAVKANNDAQRKMSEQAEQVRSMRTQLDNAAAEKARWLQEKKGLETRAFEAGERARDEKQMLELKNRLAQQESTTAAVSEKLKRAETLAQQAQKDMVTEREHNVRLQREKAEMEKTAKGLQLKCLDLETKSLSNGGQDVRFLNARIQELESQLEKLETSHAAEARSVRNVDRTVKDLQSQIERREKSANLLAENLNYARDRIGNLLSTIDELQASDSGIQLAAKRAERELREERENTLRLERELEGWKSLRVDRNTNGQSSGVRRSGTLSTLSDEGLNRRSSTMTHSTVNGFGAYKVNAAAESPLELPKRQPSLTKGFL